MLKQRAWPFGLVILALLTGTRAAPAASNLGELSRTPDEQADEATDDEESSSDDDDGDAGESEIRESQESTGPSVTYTRELSDAELERRFIADLASLGSMSIGFADEGRLMNAVPMPQGKAWRIAAPEYAWGAGETIDALVTAASAVHERFPWAAALRVGHISHRDGGHLRPHRSHQSGRDVDLGFYYDPGIDPSRVGGDRTLVMDAGLNWALLRELVTRSDVQVILVDRRIAKFLRSYATEIGEDPGWLESLFAGRAPLIQHARRHRDHFHVRFYAPRSQELGRRVQPLLAKRPDTNLMVYRVRAGDTLGHIAARFGSSVSLIQRANRMTTSFLSLSRSLVIPLRGPCISCPLPPPVQVPHKRIPPAS